jgi:CheY-like chemotaxis protein/transcriptional regulator with XRE-family HTH domain
MTGQNAGPFHRSLSDRVRFARRIAGISQRDLAAAIGSRLAQVRRYETGGADISAATLLRIAVALDVPLAWLYGVDDSDHWPDTLLAEVFRDPQIPALVSAFARIPDDENRRLLLAMAAGMGADGIGAADRAAPPPAVALPPPAPKALPAPADGRPKRALLVDDAPDVLVVVGAFLRSGGYDVVRVHDAEAALDVLGGNESLDVLVTDYAMPGMNGLELVRRASQLRPGLAAVVITAFTADLTLAAGRLPDVVLLAKPFARADLLEAMQSSCDRAVAGPREV